MVRITMLVAKKERHVVVEVVMGMCIVLVGVELKDLKVC